MQNYSWSTIFMIIFFALVALASIPVWAAPGWLMAIVAALVAICLAFRK